MNSTNNPYSAPRSRVKAVSNEGVTPIITEVLGSASIWARFTSIINWISFVLMSIFILLLVFAFVMSLFSGAAGSGGNLLIMLLLLIIYSLPTLMYWYYARSMGRYATAAKQVRESADQEDVAICFSASSTFMKVTVFFAIVGLVFFVLGIVAALALPAYQGYIQSAQF